MNLWIVTGKSESGDHYGPIVMGCQPTELQLDELAQKWDGDPNRLGPGRGGSYVFVTVKETEVVYSL
jgi:hypothetical protein